MICLWEPLVTNYRKFKTEDAIVLSASKLLVTISTLLDHSGILMCKNPTSLATHRSLKFRWITSKLFFSKITAWNPKFIRDHSTNHPATSGPPLTITNLIMNPLYMSDKLIKHREHRFPSITFYSKLLETQNATLLLTPFCMTLKKITFHQSTGLTKYFNKLWDKIKIKKKVPRISKIQLRPLRNIFRYYSLKWRIIRILCKKDFLN